jgi:NitT/TauT family transport system substrate-binding protein
MTTRGKIVFTLLILGVVAFGSYRWWDKIAPAPKSSTVSVNPQGFQKALNANTPNAAVAPDVTSKLLKGTNAVSLIGESAIPAVAGVSDYAKTMKDGKLIVQFPINVWPGWAPIIVANGGMEPSEASVFFKRYGFYVKLSIVDDPVKARDLFASGHSHILWGTLDMIALFAPELAKDSRTIPVVAQQVDWSDGGDGIVARGDIRTINDLRM